MPAVLLPFSPAASGEPPAPIWRPGSGRTGMRHGCIRGTISKGLHQLVPFGLRPRELRMESCRKLDSLVPELQPLAGVEMSAQSSALTSNHARWCILELGDLELQLKMFLHLAGVQSSLDTGTSTPIISSYFNITA